MEEGIKLDRTVGLGMIKGRKEQSSSLGEGREEHCVEKEAREMTHFSPITFKSVTTS